MGESQFQPRASKRSESLDRVYFFRLFLSGRCVNAEPATLFTFLEVPLLRSNREAVLPTRMEVFSFLAISVSFPVISHNTIVSDREARRFFYFCTLVNPENPILRTLLDQFSA